MTDETEVGVHIQLDRLAIMMLQRLRELDQSEPQRPGADDEYSQHHTAERALLHYEWERQRQACRLMLQIRLLSLALDQL